MERSRVFVFVLLLLLVASSVPGAAAQPFVGFGPLDSITAAQIRNIVEAVIGAGNFSSWANVLFGLDPTTLPVSSTLFIPSDGVLGRLNLRADFDPGVIQYHIVPRRFTFADLRRLRAGDRLPTLLSNRTILITGVEPSNFTIDDTPISRPDIYSNDDVAVHGIGAVLDYDRYGDSFLPKFSALPPMMLEQGVNYSPAPGDATSSASCSRCMVCLFLPVLVVSLAVIFAG